VTLLSRNRALSGRPHRHHAVNHRNELDARDSHGRHGRGHAHPSTRPAAGGAPSADEPAKPDLEDRVRVGTRWSALNSIVVRVGGFVVGIVLARTVFGPTVYGLYAVSQVVLAVLLSTNELGVSAAIVRWEGDVRSFARTVFTLSLMTSTALYVMLYATAPFIARVLGSPDATSMFRVLSICAVIDGACAAPLALLTREFAQGRRMVVDLLNFGVGTLVTLWLAFSGLGAMSFAWGGVAGSTAALIAAMVASPYFVLPGWNGAQARQLVRYGLPLAGASLFTVGVVNVDSAIVGATLGPTMLGLYQLAFNISSWPVTTITTAVQRVSLAGFSRVAGARQAMEDAFTQSLGLLMTLSVPPSVLLATLAGPLIRIIYGERWISAAPALSLLALFGLTRVSYVIFGSVITAADRRKTLMVIQGMWLVALVPVLLAGARLDGITGVSAGQLAVAAGLVGPAFVWAISRVNVSVWAIVRACLRPLIGGVLLAAVSLLIVHFAGDSVAALGAAIIASCAVYLSIVYPTLALLRRSPSLDPEVESTEPGAISRESQLEGLKALLDVATLQGANMSWTEPGVVSREPQEPGAILRESQLEGLKALLDLATLQTAGRSPRPRVT
jgi:O-antigen/teichoic acid export membrane protein